MIAFPSASLRGTGWWRSDPGQPHGPSERRGAADPHRRGRVATKLTALLALAVMGLSACGSSSDAEDTGPDAQIVALPGAGDEIDFDDITYASDLERVLVPARQDGLYLVEPDSGIATRLEHEGAVDSADVDGGLLFLLDRSEQTITVVDSADARQVASVTTSGPPDYLRYIAATNELWVTEPATSPSGMEIFALGHGEAAPDLRRDGFIAVPSGPEGFATDPDRGTAYTHAGDALAVIDVRERDVTARWPTGCSGTHGFPRIDSRRRLGLASCADDGQVVLLDLDDGHHLGRYAVAGGEALPAYSEVTGHFYVRADPGTRLATLAPSDVGLDQLHQVNVPEHGHCLTADDRGHYWTCDSDHGRVLKFDDANGQEDHLPRSAQMAR